MRRILGVSLVLLSTLGFAGPLCAQQTGGAGPSGQQDSGFQIHQNYPNPFNPTTTIPFSLGESLFVDGSVEVSVRIYNILQQEVAIPVPKNHPMGEVPLLGLEYTTPGVHEAFWDGKDKNGRQVPSGVYLVRLTVNGQSKLMKMYVAK
ncbi:MAG: hypothetical protein PVI57_19825 [Gemmatimonadota bacterium]|jgi:hypothetical protein